MKKVLLASTAIVGGALMASSAAMAGNVTSGDNYSIRLGGIHRFMIGQYSKDQSTAAGRGYAFISPFSELWVKAKATADNGLTYGVDIEIETRGDAGFVADEVWAYVDSDQWGRVEMGDQDGAANRMKIAGNNALKAMGGYFGGLGTWQFATIGAANFGGEGMIARSDWFESVAGSGDDTKLIYFTPRFAGFQLGASLTPDTNVNGRNGGATDNDGGINNLWEIGANYVGKYDDFGFIVATTYSTSSDTDGAVVAGTSNTKFEDFEYWTVGAQVSFGGFKVAAGYQDHNETGISTAAATAGTDAGEVWNVGVGYTTGPWGVSLGYFEGERDVAGQSAASVTDIVLGAQYAVAPGWTVMGELSFYEHENPSTAFANGATSADSQIFVLTNQFVF